SMLMEKDPLLVSAASCQVLSNVPSAILLSQFSSGWRELLVGVNIGGTGTLIASLASLITYRAYVGTEAGAGKGKTYILEYSAVSFSFLLILILFEKAVLPLY
ncbi:MAG: citrate transporter, partial [Clostridia bacterium]|nr:citrate transporter [Clostridia bacterium]